MRGITVRVGAKALSALDRAADGRHMPRSAFVRASLEAVRAEERRRHELREVVDSYRTSHAEDFSVSLKTLRAAWPE